MALKLRILFVTMLRALLWYALIFAVFATCRLLLDRFAPALIPIVSFMFVTCFVLASVYEVERGKAAMKRAEQGDSV